MADIFISYSREDRERAGQVAQALQAQGLDVFWDSEIPPGATWADYIESKLTQCKALVVLWSEHSTKSQWVREEARMARDRGKLIPAMLDNSQPPFGFGEVQAANLSSWNGQGDHPEWRRFADAVRNAAGAPPMPARPATIQPPPQHLRPPQTQQQAGSAPPKQKSRWPWVVGAVVATIVVLAIIGNAMQAGKNGPQTVASTETTAPDQPAQPQQPVAAPGADQAQQIILAQLQQITGAMNQQGFQMVGPPASGGLQQGQTWNLSVNVVAGVEYRLAGVCDRDCSDLDLVLFDPNNQQVAQDTSTDDHPLVAVQPSAPGNYTVQVQMYRCAQPPCYYAVALYGRRVG